MWSTTDVLETILFVPLALFGVVLGLWLSCFIWPIFAFVFIVKTVKNYFKENNNALRI